MTVGVLILELYFPEGGSLKEKRQHLRSIKDKLRSRFNVSVSEVDYQELWQRASLAVALVGSDARYIQGSMAKILNFVEDHWSEFLLSFSEELLTL
jgi:uncharacterized protein YlxP (DUF503 family)